MATTQLFFLFFVAGSFLFISSALSELMDSRDIFNGTVMFSYGYLDQPYCVVNNATHEWTCVITADEDQEGGPGEHMISILSEDGGQTWSSPVVLEPNITLANSYGVVVITPAGRIYCMYNMNLDNITTYPDGKPLSRTDELGHFVMKYSDDGGRSWSPERYEVPYPETPIDFNNTFEGKTKMMWSVDQVKVLPDLSVTYAFTKIGTYIQSAPEEVFFLTSSNLMTAENASDITWTLYPEGDHGLAPPGGNPNILEEGHFMDLVDGGCYAIGRTTQGLLAASQTTDDIGASGWITTSFAKYWNNTLSGVQGSLEPSTQSLANPRGPITMKRFHNNLYLLLFYNNHDPSFDSRNPYWLASGKESGGQILWSQPEIIIYNRVNQTDRPGYPDFIEDLTTGAIHITETQKLIARIHKIDSRLLDLLWIQDTISTVAPYQLNVTFNEHSQGTKIPAPLLPSFLSYYEYLQGFTVDFLLVNHVLAQAGDVLLDTRTSNGQGIAVVIGENHVVSLVMSDGTSSTVFNGSTDAVCTQQLISPGQHYVGIVADGGPRIVSFVVDGSICDGGSPQTPRGWYWFNALGSINGSPLMSIGPKYHGNITGGHFYPRMLQTTELVGNYRASLL